jgi:hypothetical protein
MGRDTKVSGKMIYRTDKVRSCGLMDQSMRVNTKMVSSMALATTSGLTEVNTEVYGTAI